MSTKVLIMGITFKENVTDIRNSKVIDVVRELKDYGIGVDIIDPGADSGDVMAEYGLDLIREPAGEYDAVILAVSHMEYMELDEGYFSEILNKGGIIIDVKGILRGKIKNHTYWSL
jgi:UDP-N-acetyl-D-galactosamine dehydrogenase